METNNTARTAEVRANYDRLSRYYDLLAGIAEKKYKLAGLAVLQAKAGEHILEVGFGTGQCILPLARDVGEAGFVDGIELSAGMCQVAEKKVRKAGFQDRVNLCWGDARELSYADGLFDAVYLSFTLELFDDPDISVVLQQIRRVLKSDGRLCVVAMAKRERTNLITHLYEWMHQRFPQSIDCRPIYPASALMKNGFAVDYIRNMSLYGLPVDIVLAR